MVRIQHAKIGSKIYGVVVYLIRYGVLTKVIT